MSVNKVILVGRLGRDPETRLRAAGRLWPIFRGNGETYKDKNGERQEAHEWHKIVVWASRRKSRSSIEEGLADFIEGRIQSVEWQDKEGQKRTSF